MIAYLKLAPYAVIAVLLAIVAVQTARLAGARETVKARADRIEIYENIVLRAKTDMNELRAANQRREKRIMELQIQAEAAAEAQGLADSLALELAKAENELAALDMEKARLVAALAPLSLCDACFLTLQEIAGGGP